MISNKTLNSLEYNKILSLIKNFAVLDKTKAMIDGYFPISDYENSKNLLQKTKEAYNLLFNYGVQDVEYFDGFTNELDKATKGFTLSIKEILMVGYLLKSSRITSNSIINVNGDDVPILKALASSIFYDNLLENEIFSKLINDTTVADNASEKLYQIRQNIRNLNERIREKLASYMRAGANKYMQDNVVSMRSGRYVIPIKNEHVNKVKGLIHDRSQSGNTFFIEPQEILELNNALRNETINELEEIERILSELTKSISVYTTHLYNNLYILSEIDFCYARAHYAFKTRSIMPKLNSNGYINIINGRHPLIDKQKVVPISISLGKDYNYILISGPNTGGKTVTLKLVGLFTLMAISGIFIPASEDSEISVFSSIFVDVGDEQSIEQNLSTFSSHVKNIIEILDNANENSLVLIDELGAGTDPDEGSALAMAITENLLFKNTYGIITTHFSSLKEFALKSNKITNASMDFDEQTFAPLYKIRLGTPGLSNAIEISKRLGLSSDVIESAKNNLSSESKNFKEVLYQAEKARNEQEKLTKEIQVLKDKEQETYDNLLREKQKFESDKEKFFTTAKAQARKIVNERLDEAESLLLEMKEIFNKEEYYKSDLVKMSTLKNKIENQKYFIEGENDDNLSYKTLTIKDIKIGDTVFVKSLGSQGEIIEITPKTIWIQVGSLKINSKIDNLALISTKKDTKPKPTVNVKRTLTPNPVKPEINVIGLAADEALMEVENFLDRAITSNFQEVRIVHGKGLKILSNAIHNYLKTLNFVESYRFGKYGEGEHGVTIVKLK